jgi:hypothetical protein
MKFLTTHRNKTTGKVNAQFRTKAFKFGDVLESERVRVISRYMLIAGKLSSGKTRYLTKLYENAEGIWRDQLRPFAHTNNGVVIADRVARGDDRPSYKMKRSEIGWTFPTPVFILANATQSEWIDLVHVAAWWDALDANAEMPYKKLKAHEKRAAIVEYLRVTRAVLFIDDIDKVSAKKIQFFKELLGAASRVVMTASTLNQIPQGLRMIITQNEESFQHVELTTDASFDATHFIMLFMIAISVMSGQWALAAFGSAIYGFANKGVKTKF